MPTRTPARPKSTPRQPAAPASPGGSARPLSNRPLTNRELLDLAKRHRPPQAWYDEGVNPFAPESTPADASPADPNAAAPARSSHADE